MTKIGMSGNRRTTQSASRERAPCPVPRSPTHPNHPERGVEIAIHRLATFSDRDVGLGRWVAWPSSTSVPRRPSRGIDEGEACFGASTPAGIGTNGRPRDCSTRSPHPRPGRDHDDGFRAGACHARHGLTEPRFGREGPRAARKGDTITATEILTSPPCPPPARAARSAGGPVGMTGAEEHVGMRAPAVSRAARLTKNGASKVGASTR